MLGTDALGIDSGLRQGCAQKGYLRLEFLSCHGLQGRFRFDVAQSLFPIHMGEDADPAIGKTLRIRTLIRCSGELTKRHTCPGHRSNLRDGNPRCDGSMRDMLRRLLDTMNEAFDAGQRMGAIPYGSAIDCPITHARIMERMSWMNGFSRGRSSGLPSHERTDIPV
ncbi:hypothetical protein N4G62_04655 [Sphingomonas sanguinis]|uniref:Uncharacterized protein n=2 Tax=Sphingomonas sanguinis TaxID=33051 RepID=A0ABU5LN30_9SPHN|nr:hypothetical protein [Sphingomonas sanguinis]